MLRQSYFEFELFLCVCGKMVYFIITEMKSKIQDFKFQTVHQTKEIEKQIPGRSLFWPSSVWFTVVQTGSEYYVQHIIWLEQFLNLLSVIFRFYLLNELFSAGLLKIFCNSVFDMLNKIQNIH